MEAKYSSHETEIKVTDDQTLEDVKGLYKTLRKKKGDMKNGKNI